MKGYRSCLIALAVGGMVMVGCGWQGPATILLRDGSSIRCPNIFITKDYVSCEGMEGGERIFPNDMVTKVIEPPRLPGGDFTARHV